MTHPQQNWQMKTLRPAVFRWNRQCVQCGIYLLTGETVRNSFCCGPNGDHGANYVPLPPLPPNFDAFLNHRDISSASRKLNLVFSFASLETTIRFPHLTGGHFVAIQGKVYHRIRPHHGSSAIRWILFDGFENDAAPHPDQMARLPEEWVAAVREGLTRYNPFVDRLIHMSNVRIQSPDTHIILRDSAAPEIAALFMLENTTLADTQPRSLTITTSNNQNQSIHSTSSLWEPLAYPLLFPHATRGWGSSNNGDNSQTLMWHVRQRILREQRFAIFGRLTNEYLVDMWSRALECRLQFIRAHQQRLAAEDAVLMGQEFVPETENIFLPSSFIGSRRWTSEQVSDALALAANFGPPTFFITMTCNPNWPEIQSQLRPGQTFADMPTVVVRVFKQKFYHLLKTLKTMFTSRDISVVYLIHSIEFQKRGLPHAHVLIKYSRDCVLPSDIDLTVSAELPTNQEDRHFVESFMLHKHPATGNLSDYCTKGRGNTCRFGYPFTATDETSVTAEGRVIYRRRSAGDAMVVPYNLALLRAYNCHINIEVANTSQLFQYIFKYIHKGPDYAHFRLQTGETEADGGRIDEIDDFWNARYLTATEAAWRIFGFHVVRKEPAVTPLPIHPHDSTTHHQYRRRNVATSTMSMLDRYFHRPIGTYFHDGSHKQFSNLKYIDFYALFRHGVWDPSLLAQPGYFSEDGIPVSETRKLVIMRDVTRPHVSRLAAVRPSEGERYYLRALLQNRPATSFEGLRTVDGITCDTYQEACSRLGLFAEEREAQYALREAVEALYTPPQLRRLFVDLLVNECCQLPLEIWTTFKAWFSRDHYLRMANNVEYAENLTLLDINRALEEHGKTLSDYGLPGAYAVASEIRHEIERWGSNISGLNTQVDNALASFNGEQLGIYNSIMDAVNSGRQILAFIDGKAGRGKTYLLNTICNALRACGQIVIPTASSAFAAQLYPGGRTTHSAYKIPVTDGNQLLESTLSPHSSRAELLRASALDMIDEAPMAPNVVLSCIDGLYRTLHPERGDVPFGGHSIILVGDFRQTCPVIRGGTRAQVVAASIRSSHLWELFTIFRLTIPIRNATDLEYSAFIDEIGEGAGPIVTLPETNVVHSEEDLINRVWPQHVLENPVLGLTRSILAPLNSQVDHFNELILARLPEQPHTYIASDSLKEATEQGLESDSSILDYVAARNPHGLPQHTINIKTGAVFQILRNLSLDKGLVKNTRVVIVGLRRRLVVVRKLTAHGGENCIDGEDILLPRIKFLHDLPSGHTLIRVQFPIGPAYASTFTGCQGLTLDVIGAVLYRPVFSHGQLYTALSRVRNRWDVFLLMKPGETMTLNVTFHELLL